MITEFQSPPRLHVGSSIAGLMLPVCIALVPGLFCYVWFFGTGILVQCLLALAAALLCEGLLLYLTGKSLLHLQDGSVIVTALLFALSLSPFVPWWQNLLGISFAIVCAKHLYGGLGYNLFNPAMAGYVFILLSFPAQMNLWPGAGSTPALADYLSHIFTGRLPAIDAISGASPLNHMQSQLNALAIVPEILRNPIYGSVAGYGWEVVNLAFLAGGLGLLFTGIIRWHIPAGVLTGLGGCSLCFYILDDATHVPPLIHLLSGGTMLSAFFIATDPVTAPTTTPGRVLYGLLIGVLVYVIRAWGSYPDGIAFAVLTANMFAPLLSHYTRPARISQERR